MKCALGCRHRTKLIVLAISLIAFLSSSQTIRAQTQEDAGLWLMLMMDGSLGSQDEEVSRLRWWLDLQPRFLEDHSGLKQGLLRPGLGWATSERTTAWLGYARIYTASETGPSTNEDRIWQQFLWKPRMGAFGFQSRTRLEQRFLDSGGETGWRFRQFVKASWDIPGTSGLSLGCYDELFFDLNRTNWGQRSGLAQNRLFLGVAMQLDERGGTKLEVGYLNQFLEGDARDTYNHILSINLFLSF